MVTISKETKNTERQRLHFYFYSRWKKLNDWKNNFLLKLFKITIAST